MNDQDYLKEVNPQFHHPIIEVLKNYADEHRIPIIQDEAIHFMIQLMTLHQTKKVLEIGTAIGYSAILIALFSDAQVISIEHDERLYQMAKENIQKAGLSDRVQLILGDANDMDMGDESFDMIFIDAAKASYEHFFNHYAKHLNKGGFILTDNLLFKGLVADQSKIKSKNRRQLVKKIDKFNHFLVNHPAFDSYIYAIGDGVSVSIKK